MKKPAKGYYLMAGQCISDGPFTTLIEAVGLLLDLCPEGFTPPERLKMFCASFDGTVLDLVKDYNGEVINGDLARHRELGFWKQLSDERPKYQEESKDAQN